MNIVFIIVLTALIVAAYFIGNKKLSNPVLYLYSGYLFMFTLSIYSCQKYNYIISNETYLCYIILILSIFIGFFISYLFNRKKPKNEYVQIKSITIKPMNCAILFSFQTIVLIIFIIDFQNCVGDVITFSNLSELIHKYRMSSVFGDSGKTVSLMQLTNQLMKCTNAITYVALFCVASNIKIYKKEQVFYCLINCFPSLIMKLLTGSRMDIICYIFFFIAVILCTNKGKNNLKMIIFLIGAAIISILIFSVSRFIVGRGQSETIIDYVADYFGNSILCFDYALKNYEFNYIGLKNTLFNVFSFFSKFGLFALGTSFNKEFVSLNGVVIGNVYGGIFDYYLDLRVWGIILFGFLIGLLSTSVLFYLYRKKTNQKSIFLIVYAKIFYSFFLDSFAGYFFQYLLSLNFVIELAIMIIVINYFAEELPFCIVDNKRCKKGMVWEVKH